jgi:glycogen(starch) synthase
LNIVFINPEYPSRTGQDHGGIATYTYSMANALAKEGVTVHVLAKSRTRPDSLFPGVQFHHFDHAPLSRAFPGIDKLFKNDTVWERGYSLAAKEIILKLHAENPVDCVEIPEYNGLAFQFTPPLPFPVVVHFHTPTYLVDLYNARKITRRQKRWYLLEKKALDRASGFRSPSNALKKEVCNHYGITENRVSVVHHPIDTSAFDAVARSDAKKDVVDVLFSGRLERRKGGDILLRDAARILSLDPRINITIAGEFEMGESGNYRYAVERSLTEKQRHRLWLLGPTKRSDLAVLYRRSDIFLMPSLFENSPYALMEAMASKVPIIASNTGGIAELIMHQENGLLFDPENHDGLVECVKQMLSKPRLATDFSQQAYNDLKRNHAPKKIAEKSMEFYSEIINKFKSGAVAQSRVSKF